MLYFMLMDLLRKEEIARVRRTPLSVRLVQALETMSLGITLKRSGFRHRYPNETEDQIESRIRRWLQRQNDY